MKTLEKLAKQRSTIPILQTVMIKDGIATATDLDTTIMEKTDLAPGLYNGAGITSGKPIASMVPVEDFPGLSDYGDIESTCALTKDFILEDLAWVLKAASTEETRYYLNGVCFHSKTIVATDGHRMHKIETDNDMPHGDFIQGAIIPRQALKFLIALVKEHKKETDYVRMTFHKNRAIFILNDNGAVLITRYVDGTFPNYQRILPSNDPVDTNSTVFNPDDFKAIVKRMREVDYLLKSRAVKLNNDGTASFAVNDEGQRETMPVSSMFTIEIGFNTSYLADTIPGTAFYTDAESSIRIDNGNKTAVVMPLRM